MARIEWDKQDSVRLKVTDRCAWNCRWCHNEGTGARRPSISGDVYWDEDTQLTLAQLSQVLPIHEVHLTGGEPTLHPDLPRLITGIRYAGFRVKATSVGCNKLLLQSVISSGLDAINFSVHAIDPLLLARTQSNRTVDWCARQLAQVLECISLAAMLGTEVKVNTVLSTLADVPRVRGVLNWVRARSIPLRIMNDLGAGIDSIAAIAQFIKQSQAVCFRTRYLQASSSYSSYYRMPDGYEFAVKQIRPHFLADSMCSRCAVRRLGKCSEGFYGLRLQKSKTDTGWQLEARLCVHRSDEDTVLSIPEFLHSKQLAELKAQLADDDLVFRRG